MANTIYEALHESHEIQRSKCRQLLRAKPEGRDRQQVLRALRIELAAHAAAEERFLYAAIIMDDMGLDSSRHALSEHHEIDECVEALSKADAKDRAWLPLARALSHQVHHHLREEEKKFFQVSGKILTERQKRSLAGRYRKDYLRMHRKLEGA
jgi:hypothetical protein